MKIVTKFTYLLTSIILGLVVRFCKLLLSTQTAWLAGAIFAVHPIHTEAVAGIVGRAEVRISYMFYILLKGSCIDVNGGG